MASTEEVESDVKTPLSLKLSSNPRVVRADLPKLAALISGGQNGSDQAGLRAAAKLGLATGGFAPLGWRTLDGSGSFPELGSVYGLVESWSADYPPRTARNVFAADATVRICRHFDTPGEICTRRYILQYKKPSIDVFINNRGEGGCMPGEPASSYLRGKCLGMHPFDVLREFLVYHDVKILNVAGNSEQSAPGIGIQAESFLINALSAS